MLPTRLALATLSASRRWWILLFVLVPIGLLAGSLWITPRIANGIVGICGFLALVLWSVSYYNYSRSRVRIDADRTVTVTFGNAGQLERAIDLGQVESVSVYVLGTLALVRIEEHTFSPLERFLLPEPLLVPADRLPAALEVLRRAGVTAPESSPETASGYEERSVETIIRLAVTPLVLVGVPLCAIFVFGQSVLVTNGTVMVTVLGMVAIGRELLG